VLVIHGGQHCLNGDKEDRVTWGGEKRLSTNLHGLARIGAWFAQLCCSKQSPVLLLGREG